TLSAQPCELLSHSFHLLRELEPEVLQRFGSAPVQRGRSPIVTPPASKISLGYPGCGPVRPRGELRERIFRLAENLFGLVQPVLLQQRAPQNEACVADLVHPVGAGDRRLTVA